MANLNLLAIRPKCACCGDTTSINVRLCWRRDSDQKLFDICMLCAETPGKVNAESVNAYGPSAVQDVEQYKAWFEARAAEGYPD
jgi:hypothetical protein